MRIKIFLTIFGFFISITANTQYSFNIKSTFRETNHQIISASYSSEGNYIVTAGSDNNIIIWNAETGIIYRTFVGLKKRPGVAIFSEKDQLLVSGGEDNIITIWNPVLLKTISTLEGHKGPVKTLDISPDGQYLASGSADRTIRIWDIIKGTLIYELKGHKNEVNSVRFSPDGKILASGGADKTLILWSVANGNIIRSGEVHSGGIRDVVFSPDGNYIASCGDDYLIQICKVQDLSIFKTLRGHKDQVQTLDYSNDGKYLISGGNDQIIILWDAASGEKLCQSEKQGQIVLSVDICPTSADFISASLLSENLETRAFSGPSESLLERIQSYTEQPPPVFAEKSFILKEEKENTAGVLSNIMSKKSEEQTMKEAFEGTGISLSMPEPEVPVIELFAPLPIEGRVIYEKNNIYLIGRVSDKEGISTFFVNKNLTKLSEAGVFQFNLSLNNGENPVEIIAINNKGKMNEVRLVIDCNADVPPVQNEVIPEIYKGRYFAFLIGINDYQSLEISDLDKPIKDAESLYNVLLTQYTFEKENIIFLKNPTQSDIIMTLDDLGKKLNENDNLLIFYAGHGHWDDKGKIGYWFPTDASKNNTVNWFRNSTLRDFIGSIVTKHTLLIADACFSGAIFKSRAAFTEAPQGIETLYELPSRKAMTSGILQIVPDESVFIKYLVKRLEENQEKFLPSELLFSSFKTAVMNNSLNVPQFGVIQNVGDEGGDFIFIKR
jgi:hypothetical protein